MPEYRVYFIGRDDHIFAAEVIEAADDPAVIAMAERLCAKKPECRAVEIWERARQVHRHPPKAAD